MSERGLSALEIFQREEIDHTIFVPIGEDDGHDLVVNINLKDLLGDGVFNTVIAALSAQPSWAAAARALRALDNAEYRQHIFDPPKWRLTVELTDEDYRTIRRALQNESQGQTILNVWQLMKASECSDPCCNSAYKYLEIAVYGGHPPVKGQLEAVRLAIEFAEGLKSMRDNGLAGELQHCDLHTIILSDALIAAIRSLPAGSNPQEKS